MKWFGLLLLLLPLAAGAVNLPTCCCQVAGSTTTGPVTTTTTTLPGGPCDGLNAGDQCASSCVGGVGPGGCLPPLPADTGLICVDLGTAAPAACTTDADCGSQHCVDATAFGPPTACADICTPAPTTTTTTIPCAAHIYCRCNFDPGLCSGGVDVNQPCTVDVDCPGSTCGQKPLQCTVDGDCPSGFVCRLTDNASKLCYHPACTMFGCADGESTCDTACVGHGGRFASFCRGGTCVGGANNGLECTFTYDAIDCPGGTCTGAQECSCTTSTTTTTTTTTL